MVFDERLSLVAGMLQRFTWERSEIDPTSARIALGGQITIDDAAALWKRISETLAHVEELRNIELDLTQIQRIDGACMALLVQLRTDLRHRKVQCEFVGGSPDVCSKSCSTLTRYFSRTPNSGRYSATGR